MKIYKPKFWDENIGIFALILLPLSIIFTIIIFLKKKFTKGQKFKVPVICVEIFILVELEKHQHQFLLLKN